MKSVPCLKNWPDKTVKQSKREVLASEELGREEEEESLLFTIQSYWSRSKESKRNARMLS